MLVFPHIPAEHESKKPSIFSGVMRLLHLLKVVTRAVYGVLDLKSRGSWALLWVLGPEKVTSFSCIHEPGRVWADDSEAHIASFINPADPTKKKQNKKKAPCAPAVIDLYHKGD